MKFGKTIEDASKLTQDANNRLVTDAEKAAWNNKVDNSRVLTDVPVNAKFTDTNTTYSEITTTEIDAGTASTLRTITGRRVKYIIDKVQAIISALTKADVGLSNVDNTSDTDKPVSTAQQLALNDKVDNSRVLTDVPSGAKFTDTTTTINGKTGAIVKADIVALGIPAQDTTYTSLPANGGNATTAKHLIGDDTRSVNSAPSVYMSGGSRYAGKAGWQTEFKSVSTIGAGSFLTGTYCYLETKTPWNDPSGGYPIQIAYGAGTPCWRIGTSTTAWSAWQALNSGGNADTVGGKHASDFMNKITISSGIFNANTLSGTITYELKNNASITLQNCPSGFTSGFFMQIEGSHGRWLKQIAIQQGSGGDIFTRGGNDASGAIGWGAWSKINDGGNASQVNGKSVWIGAEASKGTNANTIYFCY